MVDAERSRIPAAQPQAAMTWLPLKTPSGLSASFVCSNGHDGTLLDHTIGADGRVSPSVVCEGIPGGEGCIFHEHIRLVGWSES